jgi:hypothetical protein
MEDLPNSSTYLNLLRNLTSGKRACGEQMPAFGTCASSEGRLEAGATSSSKSTGVGIVPSTQNGPVTRVILPSISGLPAPRGGPTL